VKAKELRNRRVANGLLALGLVGVVLFGLMSAALLLSAPSFLSATNPTTEIGTAQQALTDSATTARSIDTSLASTLAAVDTAVQSLRSFETTLRQAATLSAQLDVLGQHPFAALAQVFSATADLAASTAASLVAVSASISSTRASIGPVAADLDRLSGELDNLTNGPASLLTPVAFFLGLATAVWLLVLAGLFARLGWVLRTSGR
jgi:hypothetical protein